MAILNSSRGWRMKYGLIPLREAAEAIGININVMHGRSAPKQIQKFIHNKGTANQLFDINGYKREKDEEQEVIAKTTLFVEYLYHMEDMDYILMQKITKVKKDYILSLNFSFRTSIRFIKRICEHDDSLISNFGDFYNFGHRFEKTIEKFCTFRKDD